MAAREGPLAGIRCLRDEGDELGWVLAKGAGVDLDALYAARREMSGQSDMGRPVLNERSQLIDEVCRRRGPEAPVAIAPESKSGEVVAETAESARGWVLEGDGDRDRGRGERDEGSREWER